MNIIGFYYFIIKQWIVLIVKQRIKRIGEYFEDYFQFSYFYEEAIRQPL